MSLRLQGVHAHYGRTEVLHDITLSVERNELLAVLGPSGSGKTTLLRIIAGLHAPSAGTIEVAGRDVTRLRPERRGIGLVPQEAALFPHMSVARNIAYGLTSSRLSSRDRRARVESLLDLVDLPGLGDRMPHELSGGQRQRVAVARALGPKPGVVLLDEPFAALDASLRGDVRAAVTNVLREQGVPSILITHDQDEALSVSDRVAVLHEGRIEQLDVPSALYTEPATEWVARFVGDVVVLDGEVESGGVRTGLGVLPLRSPSNGVTTQEPERVRVMLRPEQLTLTPLDGAAQGDQPAIGLVVDTAYFGHDQLVEVELAGGATVRVRTLDQHSWQRGDRVAVRHTGNARIFASPSPLIE